MQNLVRNGCEVFIIIMIFLPRLNFDLPKLERVWRPLRSGVQEGESARDLTGGQGQRANRRKSGTLQFFIKRPWSLNFSRQKLLAVTLLEVVAYLFLAKNSGGRLIGTTTAMKNNN